MKGLLALIKEKVAPTQRQPLPATEYGDAAARCLNEAANGRTAQAERMCRALLDSNRTSADSWDHDAYGLILLELRKLKEAEAEFRSAIAGPKYSIHFVLHLCIAITAQRRHAETLEILKPLCQAWPAFQEVQLSLARVYTTLFDVDHAIRHYKAALRLAPEDANAWIDYAYAMHELGLTSLALQACEGAVATDEKALSLIGPLYVDLLQAVGHVEKVESAKAATLRHLPYGPFAHFVVPDVLDRWGKIAEAAEKWRAAALIDRRDPISYKRLAENLCGQGQFTDAVAALQKAIKVDPEDPSAAVMAESLKRSLDVYEPKVKELAARAPQTRSIAPTDVIVIRGAIEARFQDIVKHYRAAHPNQFIILSTWSATPRGILDAVSPYVDRVVLNDYPKKPGINNINYQIVCAARGVDVAKSVGARRVLVTRTDVALLRPNLITELNQIIDADKPDFKNTPHITNRIIISDLFTLAKPFYHASDIFAYGNVTDMRKFWSIERMTDCCFRPEVILCRGYAKAAGRDLYNSLDDSIKAIRDLFIVRDTDYFSFYWHKNRCRNNSRFMPDMPFITEGVWAETTPLTGLADLLRRPDDLQRRKS